MLSARLSALKVGWAEIETGLPIPVTGITDNNIFNSKILGEAVALLNPASIFVISDHGFDAFGLKVHSNAPLGIIASNVPLKDDGIRCDFPPTLLALIGITPDGSTPALYGKSLLL